jgi:hypothetical protein
MKGFEDVFHPMRTSSPRWRGNAAFGFEGSEMRIVRFITSLLGLAAGLAVLAACSGASVPAPVNLTPETETRLGVKTISARTTSLAARALSGISSPGLAHSFWTDKASRLVVVGDFTSDDVDIFTQRHGHKLIGQLTGFQSIDDVATDKKGNIYVADHKAGQADVFPPGSTKPSLIIPVPGITAIAADDNGNVAAGTRYPASILIFPRGSKNPCVAFSVVNTGYVEYETFDAKGTLYFDWIDLSNGDGIGKLRGGCSAKRIKHLYLLGIGSPRGIRIDGQGNIDILDGYESTIDIFPPGSSSPSKKVSLNRNEPSGFAFAQAYSHVWVTGAGDYGITPEYDFPAGGTPISKIILPDGGGAFDLDTIPAEGQ